MAAYFSQLWQISGGSPLNIVPNPEGFGQCLFQDFSLRIKSLLGRWRNRNVSQIRQKQSESPRYEKTMLGKFFGENGDAWRCHCRTIHYTDGHKDQHEAPATGDTVKPVVKTHAQVNRR